MSNPTDSQRSRPLDGAAHLIPVVVVAVVLTVLARLPGIPYNVAKLIPAGPAGYFAAVGVAVAVWWAAAGFWLLLQAARAPVLATLVPALLLHGTLTFGVLRLTVAREMLHKVIGSPILGWAWEWEDLARFLALHAGVMLPLGVGMQVVRTVRHPHQLPDLISWLGVSAILSWPLHAAVVDATGTSNLVELMRSGGSFGISVALAGAVTLGGVAASAISAVAAGARPVARLLVLATLSIPAATNLLLIALEPTLLKYGQSFSALQFLLSAGRDQYATGAELVQRYAIACLLVAGGLALAQWPLWRTWVRETRR